uniref:Tubby-like F-box protein 3 n=2 Tax=Anthurium amnicola TaxID=1678845 RepID=A0A1D1YQB1_9ARAE
MEGDAASIWKGFLVKLGSYGLCLRSYRSVVPDESDSAAVADVVAADPNKGRCWANLPPELLRSVLRRIEVSESTWPSRKHVVACAGVCRNWRAITKEIVKTPVVSGKLTFPISLKQPGPRGFLFQCFIKRNRTTKTYHLYLNLTQALNDTGKFLLVARKCKHPTCTNYIISLNAVDISKGSSSYIGKLR